MCCQFPVCDLTSGSCIFSLCVCVWGGGGGGCGGGGEGVEVGTTYNGLYGQASPESFHPYERVGNFNSKSMYVNNDNVGQVGIDCNSINCVTLEDINFKSITEAICLTASEKHTLYCIC